MSEVNERRTHNGRFFLDKGDTFVDKKISQLRLFLRGLPLLGAEWSQKSERLGGVGFAVHKWSFYSWCHASRGITSQVGLREVAMVATPTVECPSMNGMSPQ